MTLTATEAATAASPARQRSDSPAQTGTGAAADFQTFLRMLTAQLTNQDPLDPMKTEEFAVQLATFSLVEQQLRTNSLLEAMAGDGLTAAASLIGMEARAAVAARFDGRPVAVFPAVAQEAETAVLVIRGADGAEVARETIDPAATEVAWAGAGPDAVPLPHGFYRFETVSIAGGAVLETRPAQVWGRIVEATLADGAPVLVFDDDSALPATGLAALRMAAGQAGPRP
jgi:flagellar basal-body rod modification protein FlgD